MRGTRMHRTHRAVIFAIAQLSCFTVARVLFSVRVNVARLQVVSGSSIV